LKRLKALRISQAAEATKRNQNALLSLPIREFGSHEEVATIDQNECPLGVLQQVSRVEIEMRNALIVPVGHRLAETVGKLR
jgi:hypothetical protein